jgi:outer membrane protein OmpA-like peptidoglycan-associated protein
VAVALLGALLALALLFPATKEMVVVVPSADGHVGMVVVERGDDRVILNEAYATSRVTSDGQIHLEKLQPAEVQSETLQSKTLESATFERTAAPQPALEQVASALPMFHDAIAALPPRPISFLLYFVTGTDDLTEASKLELGRMLEELRRREVADIVVIGHTDRVGNEQANDELSLARAERVKAEFVAQGIASAERIRAAGRGEREPLVPTENDVDEPLNRRVEINVR